MRSLLVLIMVQVLAESRLVYRTSDRSPRTRKIAIEFQKTPDMIEEAGLVAEGHDVTTEDGYIIRMDRLPTDQQLDPNRVVLIQHGIGGATDNWLLYGKKSLPVMLRSQGYDVWLINSRGNSYSRSHRNMTDNDQRFWQFSFHEMGYYDLAAAVDYALQMTGAENLYLIGHSRGTTCSYILLSLRPEYNQKIRLLISFAPVAYVKHAKSPVLQPFFKQMSISQTRNIARRARFVAFPGLYDDNMRSLRIALCGEGKITHHICRRPLDLFNGPDVMNSDYAYQVFATHFPDGASVKELLHFLQLAQRDEFAQYDYGSVRKNMAMYNRTDPPEYPLHKITAPVALYHSDNDYIVSTKDLNRLASQLPNVVDIHRVPNKNFCHINFIFGSQSDTLLYKRVLDTMESFQEPKIPYYR